MAKQAVILCGGLGTRLGDIAGQMPKPLLPIGDRPFLELLIQQIGRSGIRRFLLLAGHMADQVESFAQSRSGRLSSNLQIEVAVEQGRAGTGGALVQAASRLEDEFFLFNGDSLFDVPLHTLEGALASDPDALGVLALRHVPDVGRYGSVIIEPRGRIASFEEKRENGGAGLINGGVYLFRRGLLDRMTSPSSLEQDVLPGLAGEGRLLGVAADGYFIDIGLPETYAEAGQSLDDQRRRPAVFLDRDGVINPDHGHVGTVDRFEFTPGAVETVKLFNRLGYYVFIVTNQAGIAKGKFSIEDYWGLRDHIRSEMAAAGAQIDDERFCPYHPEGTVEEWRSVSDWRKPGAGMINDLLQSWPVDLGRSLLIGDNQSDLDAAAAAKVRGFQFNGGNLAQFAGECLRKMGETIDE